MRRTPIQLIGVTAVAFGGIGAGSLIAMPSASAAGVISLSPSSGPPGTRIAITLTDCQGPTLSFSDGSVNTIIPGGTPAHTVTGLSQDPNLPAGNFSGSYVIPLHSPAGTGNFSVTCTHAVTPGASVPFSVTATTSSTTVTGHASTPTTTGHTGTTPSTSGSSSGTGSGSQVSRIPSGPAQTGGGSAAGGPSWSLAMGGGSMMLTGGTMAALAYRRRSGEARTR